LTDAELLSTSLIVVTTPACIADHYYWIPTTPSGAQAIFIRGSCSPRSMGTKISQWV